MDAATVRAHLADAGFAVAPGQVRIEPRDDRWAVFLPGDLMAWFPMNSAGARRLDTERRVLDVLSERCSFRVPRVLHTASAGWQVRRAVPGHSDPWDAFSRIKRDTALACDIGRALGGILADQHARVREQDVAAWLPGWPPWPEPADQTWNKLLCVVSDARLLRTAEGVLRRYWDQPDASGGRVLVHGDLGLHNVALTPGTDEVAGIFDYDGAAWTDRHQDFRYLVFPGSATDDLLEAALEAYEPATGVKLDRARIRLCNAACAVGYLAFRCGTPPGARSCGRTLAEDLAWTTAAATAAGPG